MLKLSVIEPLVSIIIIAVLKSPDSETQGTANRRAWRLMSRLLKHAHASSGYY